MWCSTMYIHSTDVMSETYRKRRYIMTRFNSSKFILFWFWIVSMIHLSFLCCGVDFHMSGYFISTPVLLRKSLSECNHRQYKYEIGVVSLRKIVLIPAVSWYHSITVWNIVPRTLSLCRWAISFLTLYNPCMNSKSGIPSHIAWCGESTNNLGYVGGSFTFFNIIVITPETLGNVAVTGLCLCREVGGSHPRSCYVCGDAQHWWEGIGKCVRVRARMQLPWQLNGSLTPIVWRGIRFKRKIILKTRPWGVKPCGEYLPGNLTVVERLTSCNGTT